LVDIEALLAGVVLLLAGVVLLLAGTDPLLVTLPELDDLLRIKSLSVEELERKESGVMPMSTVSMMTPFSTRTVVISTKSSLEQLVSRMAWAIMPMKKM